MSAEQLTLLPEPSPEHFDVDAFATHIAEHAPKDPYKEQRIRELRAAGLNPNEITEPAESEPYTGDAYEGDLHPAYHSPPERLTAEEKAVGRAGAAAARLALGQTEDK